MEKAIKQLENISTKNLMYFVDDDSLQHFKKVASKLHQYLLDLAYEEFANFNLYFIICNIWYALQSKEKRLYLDESRRMQYSAIYFQLDYVANHIKLQNFKSMCIKNSHQLFYLAFFTALEMMRWLSELMENSTQPNLSTHYADKNAHKVKAAEENPEAFREELKNQKAYMQEMMMDLRSTPNLENRIEFALKQTRGFLRLRSIYETEAFML